MAESGGIFPKASVSYRGVEIGKVGDMRVTPTGLEVDLEIEKDSPDVPASALAVIANRSAVGEQYVDLEPPRDGGPYLAGRFGDPGRPRAHAGAGRRAAGRPQQAGDLGADPGSSRPR